MVDARNRTAYLVLRLLTALSESHLHSRRPGCYARAKDAATDALRWALQHCRQHVALAHQQLGRCHMAEHHFPNAEVSLSEASRGGDIPSLLEYARLLGRSGSPSAADLHHHRHKQQQQQQQVATSSGAAAVAAAGAGGGEEGGTSAAEWLAGALQAKAFSAAPWERVLHASAQLARVPLLWGQSGCLEAAHGLAKGLVEAELPVRARPAALILLAFSTLSVIASQSAAPEEQQGDTEESPEHRRKKLGLEARWAASTALKLLDSMETTSTRRTLLPPAQTRTPTTAAIIRRVGARQAGPPSAPGATATASNAASVCQRSDHGYGRVVTRAAAVAAFAAAEAACGKQERAVEAAGQAMRLGADLVPMLVASVTTAEQQHLPRILVTRAVHAHPWDRRAWAQMAIQ
ncbi:hypothetical protein DUNSADRAFT_3266 [Dunaliella salina]|uniref:Uncharacterized protein n=1 Tax=Dunaliella salina TaxID=3046 RepID=A0ABQ7GUB7_DUNSA|nr:hypothetical protein DUNSADRAFT_3266 [Dunaliella salina]|eukprot:KAF5838217.1 hypothetical protein DUNSADRAFT_3266 [Dunaliella salina]